MKKAYTAPVMEMTQFVNDNVITASGGGGLAGQGGFSSSLNNGDGYNDIDF
jgi:hypothetical protein